MSGIWGTYPYPATQCACQTSLTYKSMVFPMAKSVPNWVCMRRFRDKEIQCACAGLDDDEDIILTLARFHFETFAVPEFQSWMLCFDFAARHFGPNDGAVITQRLFLAIQAMRCTRRSLFSFNAPLCAACSEVLTEHERRLMAVIKSTRQKRFGAMKMELMMLCEGNDTSWVETNFESLCAALPAVAPHIREGQNVPPAY